jgi:hypothetical protein
MRCHLDFFWIDVESKLLNSIGILFLCFELDSAGNFVAVDDFDFLDDSLRIF